MCDSGISLLSQLFLFNKHTHTQNLYLRSDNSIIFIIRNSTSITIFLTDSIHANLFSGQRENKDEIFIARVYTKIS